MVEISVIIPVYNAEKFLVECLDSIANQTFRDIEIICIDDGSTDKSLDILNDYASKDDRFVVISQENKGQGAARNEGLKLVKSDYFCFMDADDMLELETFETCYNKLKDEDLDFVMYKLINYDDVTKKRYTTPSYDMYYIARFSENKIYDYNDLNDLMFYVSVSPVNKLYKSEFILKNNIKFPEGIIFEDNLFFWRMLFHAKRIAFIDEYFYIRRVHSSSTIGFGNEKWCDAIDVYNGVWDIFKDFNQFNRYKQTLYNNKVTFALFRFDHINSKFKELFFNHWKNDLINVIESHPDFIDFLNPTNKQICEFVLSCDDFNDFELLMNISKFSDKITKLQDNKNKTSDSIPELKSRNKKLEQDNAKLNNEIKQLKKKNDNLSKFKKDVISSKSWKLTSPLRYLMKILRKILK